MVDDVATSDDAFREEQEGPARDLVVFAQEGQEKALAGEG